MKVSNNKIAILILFYNKLQETISCIQSFIPSAQNIYILNNGSNGILWENLQKEFKNNLQVKFFHSGTNLGVSKGRNLLIKNTHEPWLFFVDNDITIKESNNWIHNFFKNIANHQDARIFSLKIYNLHEKEYAIPMNVVLKQNTILLESSTKRYTNCFFGGGSIINRSIFEQYGLFDETLFVGFEDFEYSLRCMTSPKGELSVIHLDDIELIHDHKFQGNKVDKKAVRERYSGKNLKASYDNIVKKYNLKFHHDWEWWAKKQIADMSGQTFFAKTISKLKAYLKI